MSDIKLYVDGELVYDNTDSPEPPTPTPPTPKPPPAVAGEVLPLTETSRGTHIRIPQGGVYERNVSTPASLTAAGRLSWQGKTGTRTLIEMIDLSGNVVLRVNQLFTATISWTTDPTADRGRLNPGSVYVLRITNKGGGNAELDEQRVMLRQ